MVILHIDGSQIEKTAISDKIKSLFSHFLEKYFRYRLQTLQKCALDHCLQFLKRLHCDFRILIKFSAIFAMFILVPPILDYFQVYLRASRWSVEGLLFQPKNRFARYIEIHNIRLWNPVGVPLYASSHLADIFWKSADVSLFIVLVR